MHIFWSCLPFLLKPPGFKGALQLTLSSPSPLTDPALDTMGGLKVPGGGGGGIKPEYTNLSNPALTMAKPEHPSNLQFVLHLCNFVIPKLLCKWNYAICFL